MLAANPGYIELLMSYTLRIVSVCGNCIYLIVERDVQTFAYRAIFMHYCIDNFLQKFPLDFLNFSFLSIILLHSMEQNEVVSATDGRFL